MKIAFCFLTINNIENELFYKEFFKDAYNYNIYINSKNNVNSFFKDYVLKPSYKTKNKTDISIVYATHYLLNNAIQDSENSIFIFLCGSNIPLISYDELYKKVINLDKPLIKTFENNKKDRYNQINSFLKKNIKYSNFTKQHPNMILTRECVKFFLDKINHIPLFKNVQCSDEHYFINMLKLYNKKFYNHQIMFCNPNLNKTQAITFNSINELFLYYLKSNDFYFMRKLNNKTIIEKNIINVIYNDKIIESG